MLNLIKAELYRLFNRKYLFIFWGILVLSSLLNTFIIRIPFTQWLSISMPAIVVPVFLWPIITDVVTGEEFKENTFRNTAAFGISKSTFFMSKVIVSAVLVLITVFVTIVTFATGAWLFSANTVGKDGLLFIDYIQAVLSALPLYIAAVTIGTLIAFIIKRQSLATFLYLGLFSVNPMAVLIGISDYIPVKKYLLTTQLMNLLGPVKVLNIKTPNITMNTLGGGAASDAALLVAAGTGMAYIFVLVAMGMLINRKWN